MLILELELAEIKEGDTDGFDEEFIDCRWGING
jgi:hypothetical protein